MKMSVSLVIMMLALVACGGVHVQGDFVKISGVVIDEVSGVPLREVVVHLYIFEQGSIFTMGAYRFSDQLEADNGKFEFSVAKGSSVQISTQSLGSKVHGCSATIDNVRQDHKDVIIKHDSDRIIMVPAGMERHK
ncbi:MAG: hypothetical protein WD672_04525 [Woeseia sp.]